MLQIILFLYITVDFVLSILEYYCKLVLSLSHVLISELIINSIPISFQDYFNRVFLILFTEVFQVKPFSDKKENDL